jgi:hypothetical protein
VIAASVHNIVTQASWNTDVIVRMTATTLSTDVRIASPPAMLTIL